MLGFSVSDTNKSDNSLLEAVIKIRNDVRDMAKVDKKLYALSDRIRDVYLKDMNIQDLK